MVAAHLAQRSRRPDGVGTPGDRRHTEQGNERKQQLLDAATELFAERGFAATRVADICTRAGVAKGLFYWYFPTKESLFAELVRTMRRDLRRTQAAAMTADAAPIVQLHAATAASVRFIAQHRSFFGLLDVERSDPAIAEVLDEGSRVYARDVERLIVAGQHDGSIPQGDLDAMTIGVLGAVSSFSHALRSGRLSTTPEQLAEFVADWVVRALTGGPH
jgi:AcrR family transcriptional regulator